MIRFPSLQKLARKFIETGLRFKLAILIALIKTGLLIWLSETPYGNEAMRNELTRLSFIAALALPLGLAVHLSEERKQWKPYVNWILMGVVAMLLAVYYFLMDGEPDLSQTYRFIVLLTGAHLLVSYAPFIGTPDTDGFWQFNKTLFLQFLNASLYSGTLYIGLLIAVQTIKYLFNIEYKFFIEIDLFIIVSTFFHTIFFLSKIPRPAEFKYTYPAGVKIFTQYVLLPLEVVYLSILYIYTGKIVLQWQLPEGQVAYLVLAFSVAGIFALLLLYPLRQVVQERWVSVFSQRYYLALLPLLVLLFIGIFRRISDYGVTENRYIVAVLAFWLAGITLYFLSGKRDDIRWIPISLSVLCFLLPIGPWNIFVVSKNSQLKRFGTILERNGILDAEKRITQRKTVSKEDREQLVSIVRYFRNRELTGLEPYFAGFKQKNRRKYEYYLAMETSLDEFVISNNQKDAEQYTNFSSQLTAAAGISVSDFERALLVDFGEDKQIKDGQVEIKFEQSGKAWTVLRGKKTVAVWNIANRVKALKAQYGTHSSEVPQDSLTLTSGQYKIILRSLSSAGGHYYGSGVLFYK